MSRRGDGSGPRRVGESLDRVTGSLGVPSSSALETVFARWEEVVGASVAAHARPRSMRDSVLVVAVDDPAWATQLRFLESDLLARLADAVGEGRLTAIEVRVAPV
jgi:predicted nucleic acid-binding Zn ribbon protein